MLKKIFTNKILIYLFSRYGTYAIQFFTSILIADRLGTFYLGVYGFVTLILNYLGQIHLGIPNALNVFLVHNKADKEACENYIASAVILCAYLSVFIALGYILYQLFGFSVVAKYRVDKYMLAVSIVAILTYFNGLFLQVLRVRNQVNQMALIQSLPVLLNFVCAIFLRGEKLLTAIVTCLVVSNIVILFIAYVYKATPHLKFYNGTLIGKYQKSILQKGLLLFLYNSCFYFIVISIRSIVSTNYTVEEFGLFTFSFTMANAVMLLLDSLLTVIFPKMVDLLSSDDNFIIKKTIETIRISYISTAHMLVYCAFLFYPIITNLVLPKYNTALMSMNLISLAILMNTNSCGYTTFLIAKNKEKYAAIISATALILNVVLGLFFAQVVKVPFSLVIIATMVTYVYFSFAIVVVAEKFLGTYTIKSSLKGFFPPRLFVPFLVAVLVSLSGETALCILPMVAYLLFNVKDIKRIKSLVLKLVNNQNVADIQ